jgi:hypothetical protein
VDEVHEGVGHGQKGVRDERTARETIMDHGNSGELGEKVESRKNRESGEMYRLHTVFPELVEEKTDLGDDEDIKACRAALRAALKHLLMGTGGDHADGAQNEVLIALGEVGNHGGGGRSDGRHGGGCGGGGGCWVAGTRGSEFSRIGRQ